MCKCVRGYIYMLVGEGRYVYVCLCVLRTCGSG